MPWSRRDLSLYWGGDINLLLWVSFIGYASSHMQAQKSWFAILIRGLILNTNLKVDINEVKTILKDFLYSEAHFGSPYIELWRLGWSKNYESLDHGRSTT